MSDFTQPRREAPTRHPVRRRAAPYWLNLLAVWVGLGALSFAHAELEKAAPWSFPDSKTANDALGKFGKSWDLNYSKAKEILLGTPTRVEVEEAISRLRLAIAAVKEPGIQIVRGDSIPYYPYLYLAVAFNLQEKPDLAKTCIDKERSYGEITKDKGDDNKRMGELASQIEDGVQRLALLARTDRVAKWLTPESEVRLTSTGRQLAVQVGQSVEVVKKASGTELKTAIAKTNAALWKLCDGELQEVSKRIQGYDAKPWKDAFTSNRHLVDVTKCKLPGGEATPENIEAAQVRLEECSRRVVDAGRQAGFWMCDGEIGELAKQLNQGTPNVCSVDWKRLAPAAVDDQLGLLPGVLTGLRSTKQQHDIENQQHEQETALLRSTAKERLPVIDDGKCITNLNVTSEYHTVVDLRTRLDSMDASQIGGKVETALADLQKAMKKRSETVHERQKDCRNLDTSALDSALAAYWEGENSPNRPRLAGLCSAAAAVDDVLAKCSGSLQEQVEALGWQLTESQEDCKRLLDPSLAMCDVPCLRQRLPSAPPRTNPEAWVRQNQDWPAQARSCLNDHRSSLRTDFLRVVSEVAAVNKGLEELVKSLSGQVAEDLTGVASDVSESDKELGQLRGAYEAANQDLSELHGVLGARSVSEVPHGWWNGDGLPKSVTESDRYEAIRDRAATSLLVYVGGRLPNWNKLPAFVVINRAFVALRENRLDDAVLSLRTVAAKGNLAKDESGSALAHASLSYFLYLKYQTQKFDLLERDARTEAKLAYRAQRGFPLPRQLFRNESFRKFFEDCRGEATR